MRAMLIINPISGTGSKRLVAERVTERMAIAGHTVETVMTTGPADATRLAQRAVAEGFDTVLACGGDGTVNEIAAVLRGTPVKLGILPCGSGNGLARHLGIPVDTDEALDIVLAGHLVAADSATVNDRPFFCTFGVGFDAEVSETFARQKRRGKLSYVRSALSAYTKYHPQIYSISANGTVLTEKAFLVAVCNASQYGNNAYIAPEASITDGLLDITIVHSGPLPAMALMGVEMMTGYINRNALIHTFRAPAVNIYRRASGPAHIDGEPVSVADTMEIKCQPGALHVYTPGEARFRPMLTPINSFMQDMRLSLRHIISGKQ